MSCISSLREGWRTRRRRRGEIRRHVTDPHGGTTVVEPGGHDSDDARSLCFTSEPLAEDWDLTGQARVRLPVWASTAGLQFVARLCDVSPEGRSRLATLGWSPDPVHANAGSRTVEIRLRPTAYLFRKGHRIRLTVALADFPRLWPAPLAGEIRLTHDGDNRPRLLLPRTTTLGSPAPELPPPAQGVRSTLELESSQSWRVGCELVQQAATLESRSAGTYRLRDGGAVAYRHEYTASVSIDAPARAAIECKSSVEVRRTSGLVLVRTASRFTTERVTIKAEIEQDGAKVFQKQWERARGEGDLEQTGAG